MPKFFRYLFAFLLVCPLALQAQQLTITGITRDSLTLNALPFVSIQVAGKARAISDVDGKFSFSCLIGDTSVFTHMGYNKKVKVHFKNEMSFTVLLGESAQLLKTFTFVDNFKPQGMEQWKDAVYKLKPFENRVGQDPNGVQTFGAGANISGALSYFSKDQKNKRKLTKEKEELLATETYREVLASDEVKQDLIKMFSLTEAEYYKKIERFNIRYPDAAHIKDRQEVINRLIQFFALKEN